MENNRIPDDDLDAIAGGFANASINEGDYVKALYNGQWQTARITSIRLTSSFELMYVVDFGYFAGNSFIVTASGEVEAGSIML